MRTHARVSGLSNLSSEVGNRAPMTRTTKLTIWGETWGCEGGGTRLSGLKQRGGEQDDNDNEIKDLGRSLASGQFIF